MLSFRYGLHRPFSTLLLAILCSSFAGTALAAGNTVTTSKLVNRFMQLDRNGDGVAFDEFMRMVESRARREFSQMDANRDSRVSKSEYRRFWSKRKAQYYRVKR